MNGVAWTEDELRVLRKGYGIRPLSEIAAELGRSPTSVRAAAKRFHIARSRRIPAWKTAFVREHYHKSPCAVIAGCVRLSTSKLYQLAERLGISHRRQGVDYAGAEFQRTFSEKYAAGWSDAEIAAAVGGERHAVGEHRRRLGLPHNAYSEHRRERVRRKTQEQLEREGLSSLGELRVRVFRQRAKRAGWPEDLRPRAVQILNALWERGPMTRRELADAIGMPWRGSRKSLVSNDPEGSYLAHLTARGLVVVLKRAKQVIGRGSGRSQDVYSLPLSIQRGPILENGNDVEGSDDDGGNAATPALDAGDAEGGRRRTA